MAEKQALNEELSAIVSHTGLELLQEGKYYKAIESFDEALRSTSSFSNARRLFLLRAEARLGLQAYDAAFEDAKVVLQTKCEDVKAEKKQRVKALSLVARASYELRQWQNSLEYWSSLTRIHPENETYEQNRKQCRIRLKESNGNYDWASVLAEAEEKGQKPTMDRADFIGPIEVRECERRDHGRGYFTTRRVEAGELLLVEKAFAAIFPADKESQDDGDGKIDAIDGGGSSDSENLELTGLGSKDHSKTLHRSDKEFLNMHAKFATTTFIKLHKNPSLQPAFTKLYAGPDIVEEVDEGADKIFVSDASVQCRIQYNGFAFPLSNKPSETLRQNINAKGPDDSDARGLWIQASYINHSCYPTVRRSFIGDLMVWRAKRDIPKDTELFIEYTSPHEPLRKRDEALAKYGIKCDCQLCLAERDYSPTKMEKRDVIMMQIIKAFESTKPHSLEFYTEKMDRLEECYKHPPDVEPRKLLVVPILNLLAEMCRIQEWASVEMLVLRLLKGMGFEIESWTMEWEIKRWGLLIDELVMAMADLCDAYRNIAPVLLPKVEAVAKTFCLIMCGEDVSWETSYKRKIPRL